MGKSFDTDDEDRDEALPRDSDEIEAHELFSALRGLAALDDDPYLRTQALNVSMVDKWLMRLESEVRDTRFGEEKRNREGEIFLGALSQMWLFAIYELLRTWRERAKNIQKWASNGGLPLKLAALEKNRAYPHLAQEAFIGLLKRVIADSSIVTEIADDLARTHVLFGQLEFLRVAIAKHQVSGKEKQLAYAPGVGRVDTWTGSMSYELSKGPTILGELKRRDVADQLRSLAVSRAVPTTEELKGFDNFMSLSPNSNPFDNS